MENKFAIQFFTIILSLATIYTLSFNFAAKNFEKLAQEHGEYVADSLWDSASAISWEEIAELETKRYLRDSVKAQAHPFGASYKEVKENELKLGLDLQGGMSVTLEVSIPDLLISLSDYSTNSDFRTALANATANESDAAGVDYISLFAAEWDKVVAEKGYNKDVLWSVFNTSENGQLFPINSSDEDIIATLRREADIALDNTENIIRKRIDRLGVAQPNVQKLQNGRILVELPGVDDKDRAKKQLKSTANLEFWPVLFNSEVYNKIKGAEIAYANSINPKFYGENAPADSTLTPEQLGSKYSIQSKIILLDPARNISNIVGLAHMDNRADILETLNNPLIKETIGEDVKFAWSSIPDANNPQMYSLYALKDESRRGKAQLSGKSIIQANQGYDQYRKVVVSMSMDDYGTGVWASMTEKCVQDNNRAVAVVLDNLVYSAPSVRSAINNGRSEITLGSNKPKAAQVAEAQDLAGLLKAGSLPAPAKIVDEVIVGPQLGQKNIDRGLMSFLIALVVVLLYMIFYYKGAGLVSNVALIANLFFLVGALAALGAALTLPGIAGIVLTIGMAVDANVLIYERIREEMRHGKGLALAVKDGYSKAYSAIIDANLTTLLTAIVLYSFGSGSIKGFATTLIIGIFTSLFSAIVITRLIFFSRLERKQNISFSSNITKNWLTNSNIDFIGKRKMTYGLSIVIILLGIGSLMSKGLKYGVEFTGGRTFDVAFAEDVNIDEVRDALSVAFTENGTPGNPTVQKKEESNELRVMTNYLKDSKIQEVDTKFAAARDGALAQFGEFTLPLENKVDPSISDDFRWRAKLATVFSLIIIFLYIFFRFRKWQFGLGALLATTHDVLIVLSVFSIFWGILPFTMEIDQAFIAAILTVIGYSINDTVVVFDRIREYLGLYGGKREDKQLVNDALNSTLSRTINTSLSTFVVLLTIFIFGGENIKGFVFALMIGVLVGTYSSIFIATPSVLDFSEKLKG